MKNELSKSEQNELRENEEIIENTSGAFIRCGKAVAIIRDKKLWRAGFASFEDYCLKRWGWKKSRAYQLIEAAEVVSSLPKKVSTIVENEAQARELSKVPPERREDVLTEARMGGKPLTGASIRQASQAVPAVRVDETGHPIPKGVLEAWDRAAGVQTLLTMVSQIKSGVKRGLDAEDIVFSEVTPSLLADLSNVYTSLKCVIPHAVCTCEGKEKKCKLCSGRGFLSKFRWEQCVPEEIRAKRVK